MTFASHIFNHSRKVWVASNLLHHERANLIRWFSHKACQSLGGGDVSLRICHHGYVLRKGEVPIYSSTGWSSSTGNFRQFQVPSLGISSLNVSDLRIKMGILMNDVMYSNLCLSSHLQSHRSFSSNADLHPHQEIGMPSLSPTMTEGNIARWLKKEGDKVSPGEVLCEVETDKATVEMECMEEGCLAKIVRGDGSQGIKVGEIIAITVEEEEVVANFKDYQPSESGAAAGPPQTEKPSEVVLPKQEAAEPAVSQPDPKVSERSPTRPTPTDDRVFSSPLARKLAEDNKVSLSNIKGTGPDGRIVKVDIEDYLASRGKEASVPATKAAAATLDYTDIPLSQIRKVTASRLLISKQIIPHYYLTVDTCVDKLMELRNQLNSIQEASGGKHLSVNDLVIKAAALALRKVPQCNSSWMDDYICQYHNVNLNIAVQTDNGLLCLLYGWDADKKGLSKISEDVKILSQKAKENSLKPQDYEGGTFTVSNLGGPFGIKQFCAIINPPQAAILAVGTAEKRVVPGCGSDQFEFASFMSVTLSCDHRVIDGANGAEWLKAFKGYIENPESMLL
ncbi:hypothetical protein Nepgr_016062 [Nepenthes gracilis]|uniref:Acetyltransferase component of pyruvate dehydrogenase complex n=1 Tax=Nepenthes gracilis TaxID=150966 RepID=A0AAD3XRW7_NEPGR|nr:hypothetical protein Nepgr_016062 [Nepenthes gracilis]